jgi:hypothetical protein
MPGFSITLLNLPTEPVKIQELFPNSTSQFSLDKETILELLDLKTSARGWKDGSGKEMKIPENVKEEGEKELIEEGEGVQREFQKYLYPDSFHF